MTRPITENMPSDISDWPGSPLSTIHPLEDAAQSIPVEQYQDGNCFVTRLELPGIDPDKDLKVTVQTGVLTIQACRRDETPAKHDSEFRYGSFARQLALPYGSDVDDVAAVYRNGILTIRIGMEPDHSGRPRPVLVEVQ